MDLDNLTPKDIEGLINKAFFIRYYDSENILRQGMDIFKGTGLKGDFIYHTFLNAGSIEANKLIYIKIK